ncbi:MAG: triose-phosphate isomerase [Bradymonadaceae bacterium]|nr:triose-phosphate isomerase [Lujinxingiaceae bacterium]
MRVPIIAGNWKMNHTVETGTALARAVSDNAPRSGVEVVVAPSLVSLASVVDVLVAGPVHVAAQNMHWADNGAYTGDVSAEMLLDVGCRYVILGHSERRQIFLESDELINRKIISALAAGLKPIVCIGESLEEREAAHTRLKVIFQLRAALTGVLREDMANVVIAYEPIWAIGTGKTASPEQAQEVHALIREQLGELYSAEVAQATRLLYGGSVKPSNIDELIAQPDIDGALVGGASLTADSFLALTRAAVA